GADIIEQILVRVNGEIITKSDLEQRQIAALRNKPEVQGLRGNDAALNKLLSEVTPQVIVDAVDELLMLQRGKELGYAMGDEQFKSIVDNIRKENKIETDEQFAEALKGEGMTMLDLRRQLEKQMLVTRVQQTEVMGKIAVGDEEVSTYYAQHKDEFASTPQVTLREILVAVAGTEGTVNVAADEAAQAKAEDIRKRLLTGEPFPRLAADLSDSPSKANGGLLGDIPWEDVSPELQKDLLAMKSGDVTKVMRTPRGYQILKMEGRTDGSLKPLAEAHDAVSEKVFEGKRKVEFQKYLVKLRQQAIIEWKNDEVKKAWEAGLKTQDTAAEAKPGR
ncbi:MAG: peptidylprolyl isomerase, partial [Acidobacteriota bacterium]